MEVGSDLVGLAFAEGVALCASCLNRGVSERLLILAGYYGGWWMVDWWTAKAVDGTGAVEEKRCTLKIEAPLGASPIRERDQRHPDQPEKSRSIGDRIGLEG